MPKATTCFVIILCSLLAFGQQEPQWKVVTHVLLTQQTHPIPETGWFTPTETTLYRVTFNFSTGSGLSGHWFAQLHATDIDGAVWGSGPDIVCAHPNPHSSLFMAILKAGVPLTYEVDGTVGANSGCPFNLAITVEQLVQQ